MKWIAVYKDGTLFPQLTEAGENLFKDIDWPRVKSFGWYGERNYIVYPKEGDEVVAFRRHHATLRSDTVEQYGLGIKGKFLMLIDNQGNVEVSNGL